MSLIETSQAYDNLKTFFYKDIQVLSLKISKKSEAKKTKYNLKREQNFLYLVPTIASCHHSSSSPIFNLYVNKTFNNIFRVDNLF